jgi:endonuclease-3
MPAVPGSARQAAREPVSRRRARARKVIAALRREYPDADCALTHRDAWELLVATILSAQCTDERVNKVTPGLFELFPSVGDFATADPALLEDAIRPTGFFKNKARSLRGAAEVILSRHGGEVPRKMEELVALPGVGRKTAHVVRGTWFGLPAITVDTHVGRLSRRLGFTREEDPVKVERQLEEVFSEKDRTFTSHALIWHGRRVCQSRKPRCEGCVLAEACPSAYRL